MVELNAGHGPAGASVGTSPVCLVLAMLLPVLFAVEFVQMIE